MEGYYGDEFKDFHKQAILMFPNLDFSQIQINLTAPTTPATEPIPDNLETNEEVVVTDKPSSVVDDLMNP